MAPRSQSSWLSANLWETRSLGTLGVAHCLPSPDLLSPWLQGEISGFITTSLRLPPLSNGSDPEVGWQVSVGESGTWVSICHEPSGSQVLSAVAGTRLSERWMFTRASRSTHPYLLTHLQEQEHILLKKQKVGNSKEAEAGQVGST